MITSLAVHCYVVNDEVCRQAALSRTSVNKASSCRHLCVCPDFTTTAQ